MQNTLTPLNLRKYKTEHNRIPSLFFDSLIGKSSIKRSSLTNLQSSPSRIHSHPRRNHTSRSPREIVSQLQQRPIRSYQPKSSMQNLQISHQRNTINNSKQSLNNQLDKTIKIDHKSRRNLSNQCRDNFIQFLLVQKAGKAGDGKFLSKLKKTYKQQLFSNVTKPPIITQRKKIAYLQNEEDEKINELTLQVLNNRVVRDDPTPLNVFIKNLDENSPFFLPNIRGINITDRFKSNMDEFQI